MSTKTRVRLSDAEMENIKDAITCASFGRIMAVAVTTTFDYVLAPEGKNADSFSAGNPLDPSAYAIPYEQWAQISHWCIDATRRAGSDLSAANAVLDWGNYGPSSYEDEAAADPDIPTEGRSLSWQDRRGPVLTLRDVEDLAAIVDGCQRTAHVRYETDHGDLIDGTLRYVCTQPDGGFLRADDDVRDAYVRITTRSGFEHFMPMPDAVKLHRKGLFAITRDGD